MDSSYLTPIIALLSLGAVLNLSFIREEYKTIIKKITKVQDLLKGHNMSNTSEQIWNGDSNSEILKINLIKCNKILSYLKGPYQHSSIHTILLFYSIIFLVVVCIFGCKNISTIKLLMHWVIFFVTQMEFLRLLFEYFNEESFSDNYLNSIIPPYYRNFLYNSSAGILLIFFNTLIFHFLFNDYQETFVFTQKTLKIFISLNLFLVIFLKQFLKGGIILRMNSIEKELKS